MTPESDDGAWKNEYEEWAAEQEEQDKLDRLNSLLRAARDGTIYDVREESNENLRAD